MKEFIKPVPSKCYIERQLSVKRLYEIKNGQGYTKARPICERLEAEFAQAWDFSSENEERGIEIMQMASKTTRTFDHCRWYSEPATKGYVVVTQPYLEPEEAVENIAEALTFGERMPQIIAAPEWAFYYPGRATLVVVKFSPAYIRILEAMDRLWWPPAKWALATN